MRKVEKNILEIKEDIKIGDIILEAGDKIQILESTGDYTVAYVDEDGDDRGALTLFFNYKTYTFVEVDQNDQVIGSGDFDDDQFDHLDHDEIDAKYIPRNVMNEF